MRIKAPEPIGSGAFLLLESLTPLKICAAVNNNSPRRSNRRK